MPKRHETRSLWGQEFDIVKAGLAEDQVAAFVEDLLKRYGDLLEGRKHLNSLRLLAETKVREADKLVSSILQEAMTKVARQNRQLSPRQIVVTDNRFNHKGDTQTAARPDEPGKESPRHPLEAPVSEEPVAEVAAVKDAPAAVAEEPKAEEAVAEAEEPVAEVAAVKEAPAAVAEEPKAEEAVAEAEEPVAEVPAVKDAPAAVAEEPRVGEVEEPVAEEAVAVEAGEPEAKEKVARRPKAEEAVAEAEEPVAEVATVREAPAAVVQEPVAEVAAVTEVPAAEAEEVPVGEVEEVVVNQERQAGMTPYLSEESVTPEEMPTTREACSPPDEGAIPSPCPYEIEIQLQDQGVPAEPSGVANLLTHLEQSPEISFRNYRWSPSSGWGFTVLVHSTRPLTSLLTEIPEIERIAEEETPPEVPITSSLPLRKGTSSPEPSQTPPKRVRIWLKEK